ncbi:MAG: hypothetical protein ACHQT6_12910, partial [Candidatus Acidiferrales bacterium]
DQDYANLPVSIRKAFAKQLRFLLDNLQHPSLHAKKYDEGADLRRVRDIEVGVKLLGGPPSNPRSGH